MEQDLEEKKIRKEVQRKLAVEILIWFGISFAMALVIIALIAVGVVLGRWL